MERFLVCFIGFAEHLVDDLFVIFLSLRAEFILKELQSALTDTLRL